MSNTKSEHSNMPANPVSPVRVVCSFICLKISAAEAIEDIYSFAANTINIFIECNENIKIYLYDIYLKRVNFLYILLFIHMYANARF